MSAPTIAAPSSAPTRADILFGQIPTVASERSACDRCPSAAAKVKAIYPSGPSTSAAITPAARGRCSSGRR